MVIARTIALLAAAGQLCACSSAPVAAPEDRTWKAEMREGGQRMAAATVRGAEVVGETVGESVGTAYRGVKNGFAGPESGAYGPYPRDYVTTIRKHMLHFGGVDKTASFQFGKPVRAYLNKGLLLGGEIDWQGWVVDVSIESKTLFGQPRLDEYVVRMKDGEIVEVVEKVYADDALRRVSEDRPDTVPAAPRS